MADNERAVKGEHMIRCNEFSLAKFRKRQKPGLRWLAALTWPRFGDLEPKRQDICDPGISESIRDCGAFPLIGIPASLASRIIGIPHHWHPAGDRM